MADSIDREDVAADTVLSADAIPSFTSSDRSQLETALQHLVAAGFYAYMMLDAQQRWTVAVDDEAGHVDVRLEEAGFNVEVCGSSPGLFIEEDSDWRRQALERLARRAVPNVARGLLRENQTAFWDEDDRGVSVCISHQLPFDQVSSVPAIARSSLAELDDLLTFVESELRT